MAFNPDYVFARSYCGPMGLRTDLNIKAPTEMPDIRDRWTEIKGKAWVD